MPTYSDPTSDAAETADATRGLAHAIHDLHRPEVMPGIVGDLLATTRHLRETLDALARAHVHYIDRASTDAGDLKTGEAHACATADALDEAVTLIDDVEARLDWASTHAHLIAWQPALAPEPQWLSVVFLQGQDADDVLALIDEEGEAAAVGHLQNFDYGTETTDAALSNGYVYATPPTTALATSVRGEDYTMVYDRALGHVGLYRTFTPDPDDALDTTDPPTQAPERAAHVPGAPRPVIKPAPRQAPTGHAPTDQPGASRRDASWFEHPGVAAVKQSRGLGR
ncbi:hypothetical protein [Brevibacterium sp. XM4083]|uniref:hypothetical protein n=1 Tax=Brevibacterium sp. XM4083 TaxID=2583238 RepID=UPI00112A019D|nr:hypothetical protein [Brevibacterium sp. XM4083]MCM1011779.1 hypothetical protein [Brevibacterium sp. XM4083]